MAADNTTTLNAEEQQKITALLEEVKPKKPAAMNYKAAASNGGGLQSPVAAGQKWADVEPEEHEESNGDGFVDEKADDSLDSHDEGFEPVKNGRKRASPEARVVSSNDYQSVKERADTTAAKYKIKVNEFVRNPVLARIFDFMNGRPEEGIPRLEDLTGELFQATKIKADNLSSIRKNLVKRFVDIVNQLNELPEVCTLRKFLAYIDTCVSNGVRGRIDPVNLYSAIFIQTYQEEVMTSKNKYETIIKQRIQHHQTVFLMHSAEYINRCFFGDVKILDGYLNGQGQLILFDARENPNRHAHLFTASEIHPMIPKTCLAMMLGLNEEMRKINSEVRENPDMQDVHARTFIAKLAKFHEEFDKAFPGTRRLLDHIFRSLMAARMWIPQRGNNYVPNSMKNATNVNRNNMVKMLRHFQGPLRWMALMYAPQWALVFLNFDQMVRHE